MLDAGCWVLGNMQWCRYRWRVCELACHGVGECRKQRTGWGIVRNRVKGDQKKTRRTDRSLREPTMRWTTACVVYWGSKIRTMRK